MGTREVGERRTISSQETMPFRWHFDTPYVKPESDYLLQ